MTGKLISFILTLFLSLAMIFEILLVFIPLAFGGTCLAVETGSMEPAIDKGSLLYIKKINFDEIKKGDIITFSSIKDKKKLFTHRVSKIDKEKKLIFTIGDANDYNDPLPTSAERVRGKVIKIFPFLGYMHILIKSPPGIAIILICIVIWLSAEVEEKIKKKQKG